MCQTSCNREESHTCQSPLQQLPSSGVGVRTWTDNNLSAMASSITHPPYWLCRRHFANLLTISGLCKRGGGGGVVWPTRSATCARSEGLLATEIWSRLEKLALGCYGWKLRGLPCHLPNGLIPINIKDDLTPEKPFATLLSINEYPPPAIWHYQVLQRFWFSWAKQANDICQGLK